MTRWRPRPEHRPTLSSAPGDAVRIRWLGTAGHIIEAGGATVLIDPFLTRPSLVRTAAFPLRPTPDLWWHWLPAEVDAILIGHSHYDHLLDAPEIARRTGARIVGSRTTASFARAAGVPADRIDVMGPGGGTVTVGDLEVRFVPSLHGRIALGRVPFDGEVPEPPHLPRRVWQYRMGGAFGILVRRGGLRIYHNGSADLVDAALDGVGADVALVGLAGRQATPRYLNRLMGRLRPKLVLPTHHDFFFAPLEAGPRLLPGIDLDGFTAEMGRIAPTARIVMPTYEDVLHVPAEAGRVREAGVTAP